MSGKWTQADTDRLTAWIRERDEEFTAVAMPFGRATMLATVALGRPVSHQRLVSLARRTSDVKWRGRHRRLDWRDRAYTAVEWSDLERRLRPHRQEWAGRHAAGVAMDLLTLGGSGRLSIPAVAAMMLLLGMTPLQPTP